MRGTTPSLPQYAFVVWCSVKAQGQLYLLRFTNSQYRTRRLSFSSQCVDLILHVTVAVPSFGEGSFPLAATLSTVKRPNITLLVETQLFCVLISSSEL